VSEKILFVDDEPNVLAGLERQLRRRYTVHTAVGGEAGLAAVAADGPFAVVVSDMRMPGMSGAQFLAEVRRRQPESVRLLLTGHADVRSAVDAVNHGGLFRFLTKPCDTDDLAAALDAAVEQYRLVTAERELLDRTVRGCVQVLGEVLALTNPAAFSRALRVQGLVREMAAPSGQTGWEVEVAAILAQLGQVAIPERVVVAAERGLSLSAEDQAQVDKASGVAAGMVGHIPRMERVAQIISRAGRPFDAGAAPEPPGTGMLRLARDFDALVARGIPRPQALALLRPHAGRYDVASVAALERVVVRGCQGVSREVAVAALTPEMTLELDLYSSAGVFLLRQGNAITLPMKLRLETLAASGQIPPTLRVLVPLSGSGGPAGADPHYHPPAV
jgi:response regulator RpfG family c-di-GMP phosphodiesterase